MIMDNAAMDRFWNRINIGAADACWTWTGYKDMDGYGRFYIKKKKSGAHRLMWIIFYGLIPEGMNVLHICDNPSCCNPNHLFLGTPNDNNQDAKNKGHTFHPAGELSGRCKLKYKDVVEIRKLHSENNISVIDLSKQFSISRQHISDILNRKYWKEP
jgi:hypothetical protein